MAIKKGLVRRVLVERRHSEHLREVAQTIVRKMSSRADRFDLVVASPYLDEVWLTGSEAACTDAMAKLKHAADEADGLRAPPEALQSFLLLFFIYKLSILYICISFKVSFFCFLFSFELSRPEKSREACPDGVVLQIEKAHVEKVSGEEGEKFLAAVRRDARALVHFHQELKRIQKDSKGEGKGE